MRVSMFIPMRVPTVTHNDLVIRERKAPRSARARKQTGNRGRFMEVSGRRLFIGKSPKLREAESEYIGQFERLIRSVGDADKNTFPLGQRGNPLVVSLVWSFRPSRKAERNVEDGTPKVTPPDLDNMAKTALDCMTRAGLIVDDAPVCDLSLAKVIGKVEGLRVTIEELPAPTRAKA